MTVAAHSIPLTLRDEPQSIVKAIPTADADGWACRLAADIARGDEAAFAELYDRYHERLFRLALTLANGGEALAHETVQSTFLTAASKLRGAQSEAHLWNWLAQVARQHLAKSRRQCQRDAAIVSMADVPEQAAVDAADHLLEEKLDAALLGLEEPERQLIEWFYFERLSHKEIAVRLGATPKAVSCRLERARARLQTSLKGNE